MLKIIYISILSLISVYAISQQDSVDFELITASENGDILTEVLTGEGNLTTYLNRTDSTGAYTSTITDPTGAETLFSENSAGLILDKSLPCGMDLRFKYDLDPEYKYKFVC